MQQRITYRSLLVVILFVFSAAVFVRSGSLVGAASVSPWFYRDKPTVTMGEALDQAVYSEKYEAAHGFRTGTECINDKRISINKLGKLLPIWYKAGCWYETNIGMLHEDGEYLLPPGASVAGKIIGKPGSDSRLYPTKNPRVFLEILSDHVSSSYIRFHSASSLQFDERTTLAQSIELNYKSSPTAMLLQSPTKYHAVQDNRVWYSSNGEWMGIWSGTGTIYRINLSTFKVLTIDTGLNLKRRLNASLDISNNGRLVALALHSAATPKLFMIDTYSCLDAETQYVLSPGVHCQQRELQNELKEYVGSDKYNYQSLPKFYGNHTLGVMHYDTKYGQPGTARYTQYYLQAPGTSSESWNYLALGDSFSSGEGAFNYAQGTDEQENNCHLSLSAYPHLINRQLNLTLFHSVACSGAKIDNVLNYAQEKWSSDEKYMGWVPGYLPQIEYEKRQDESYFDIITITMSGNDIGFSNKLKYCITEEANCFESYESRKEIVGEINDQFQPLVDMYKTLKSDVPNRKIYVLGYPQIVSSKASIRCGNNVHLTENQRMMANDLVTYFNAVIKAATKKAGVFYVGTEGALNGYKLCENISARTAVNGLTIGDDNIILGNESYHPNQLGHQLLAGAVLRSTFNFTALMPGADENVSIPDAEKYAFLQAPKNGETVLKRYYTPITGAVTFYKKVKKTVQAPAFFQPTQAYANYDIWLHSEPVHLGSVESDGAGNINAEIVIPDHVKPGMHELSFVGPNTDGAMSSFYYYVYVGARQGDFDGDGTPDSKEPCSYIQPSQKDIDGDLIDDACDASITFSPSGILPGSVPVNTTEGPYLTSPDTSQQHTQISNTAIQSVSSTAYSELLGATNIPVDTTNNGEVKEKVNTSKKDKYALFPNWLYTSVGVIVTIFIVLVYARHKHEN